MRRLPRGANPEVRKLNSMTREELCYSGADRCLDAEQRKWLLAPHQWKLLLVHILPKSQDPEADGWPDDKFSLAPTDPEATADVSRTVGPTK